MLVHHVQRLLEDNPEFGVLKTDVSNAFKSVSRQHFLQEVNSHFLDMVSKCIVSPDLCCISMITTLVLLSLKKVSTRVTHWVLPYFFGYSSYHLKSPRNVRSNNGISIPG